MKEQIQKFVAYFRVSTDKQGLKGLGIESQRHAVMKHIDKVNGKLIESFLEVASGKKSDRIELNRALDICKRYKATLIVAKLDRLARDIHFISGLQKSKVKFVAADLPEANEMLIQIIAVIAEYERKLISERTRSALAMAKANGKKLGNPSINPSILYKERVDKADNFAQCLKSTLEALKAKGYSQEYMASELTKMGVLTPGGCDTWSRQQISRVMKRLKAIA